MYFVGFVGATVAICEVQEKAVEIIKRDRIFFIVVEI
jgi:hypothetical protein